MRSSAIFAVTAVLSSLVGTAPASTIISVTQSPAYPGLETPYVVGGGGPQYLATSWTDSRAYSDVQVSFEFDNLYSPPGTPPAPVGGTAYLTKRLGSGSSSIDQIAATNFTEPVAAGWLTVFSKLSLSPGTYYLVLAGPWSTWRMANWVGSVVDPYNSWPAVSTDTGVTRGFDYVATVGQNSIPAYAPASDKFQAETNWGMSTNLHFAVTGTPTNSTPEPATLSLFAIAGACGFIKRLLSRLACRRHAYLISPC